MMTAFAVITPENLREKRARFRRVLLTNLGVTLSVCLVFFAFGRQAVRLIYGDGFRASGTVLIALIPYYFQYSVSLFYSLLLDYHGKAYARSLFYFLMVVLDFVLNYLLIPKYGATGAAVATSVSLLPYLIALIFLSRNLFIEIEKTPKGA
jgi:O-antigen/teichoic acid export membrane protein